MCKEELKRVTAHLRTVLSCMTEHIQQGSVSSDYLSVYMQGVELLFDSAKYIDMLDQQEKAECGGCHG